MKLPDFLYQDEFGETYFADHRIVFMHVLDMFNDGLTPEAIHREFPALSLERVAQALNYYQDNKEELDKYLADCHRVMEENSAKYRPSPAVLQINEWARQLYEAEQEHQTDPEWSKLDLFEKLRRLGIQPSPSSISHGHSLPSG